MRPEQPSSIVSARPTATDTERKAELIEKYVRMFATIDNRAVTDELLDVYLLALQRFEVRKIEKGLTTYLREGTRWPWPGTLAEYVSEEV